jgi:hypothetical protein
MRGKLCKVAGEIAIIKGNKNLMVSKMDSKWQTIKYLVLFSGVLAGPFILLGALISNLGSLRYQAVSETMYSGGIPMEHSASISTIQFVTQQGEKITFRSNSEWIGHREAGELKIVYDSVNPHQAIIKGSPNPLAGAGFEIAMGWILMYIGLFIFIGFFVGMYRLQNSRRQGKAI